MAGRGVSNPSLMLTLTLGLLLAPLIAGFLLWKFRWVSDVWIIQETPQRYLWMIAFTIAYAAVLCAVARPDLKAALALVAFAALCGWLCGPPLMTFLNSAADSSPAITARARLVEYMYRERRWPGSEVVFEIEVSFAATTATTDIAASPPAGLAFRVAQRVWGPVPREETSRQSATEAPSKDRQLSVGRYRSFELHRGHLGLWWGRFRE